MDGSSSPVSGPLDPELLTGVRLAGEVDAFDFDAGIGWLSDEAGASWLFHCTEIVGEGRTIEIGARVSFVIVAGAPGLWEASEVSPL